MLYDYFFPWFWVRCSDFHGLYNGPMGLVGETSLRVKVVIPIVTFTFRLLTFLFRWIYPVKAHAAIPYPRPRPTSPPLITYADLNLLLSGLLSTAKITAKGGNWSENGCSTTGTRAPTSSPPAYDYLYLRTASVDGRKIWSQRTENSLKTFDVSDNYSCGRSPSRSATTLW